MICWHVARIVTGKEAVVNRAFIRRNLETYLPMEVRSYRPSKHTKRRVSVEVPLIPRILFAAIPSEVTGEMLAMLTAHRYVTRLQRDVFGELVVIPHRQMVWFMEAHRAWVAKALERAKDGKAAPRRTKKKGKGVPMTPEVLKDIAVELFGVEDMAEESVEAA